MGRNTRQPLDCMRLNFSQVMGICQSKPLVYRQLCDCRLRAIAEGLGENTENVAGRLLPQATFGWIANVYQRDPCEMYFKFLHTWYTNHSPLPQNGVYGTTTVDELVERLAEELRQEGRGDLVKKLVCKCKCPR